MSAGRRRALPLLRAHRCEHQHRAAVLSLLRMLGEQAMRGDDADELSLGRLRHRRDRRRQQLGQRRADWRVQPRPQLGAIERDRDVECLDGRLLLGL